VTAVRVAACEWIETTVIILKGAEKSRKQNRCYLGADGKIQKVALTAHDGSSPGTIPRAPGPAGNKTDLKEYLDRAATLIHQYIPPNPRKVQAAKNAGRVAISPQSGGGVDVTISEYLKVDDVLTITLDPTARTLLGFNIATHVEEPADVVLLSVQMNTLPGGDLYAARTTLRAEARKIHVVITNTGHRPRAL